MEQSGSAMGDGGSEKDPEAPSKELSSALLFEAAEIENRLRSHVLALLEPTLRKQGILDAKQREFQSVVDGMSETMFELRKSSEALDVLKATVESFRAELAAWDKDRRGHEQKSNSSLNLQSMEIDALRASGEKRSGDLAAAQRSLAKLVSRFEASTEESEELRRYCTERLDLLRDKHNKLRAEFEDSRMAEQLGQHRLQDGQTRLETSIGHLHSELERASTRATSAVNAVEEIWTTKASVTSLESQQTEFAEFVKSVNAQFTRLDERFGALGDDVKAHIQTASRTVGTSVVTQMNDFRIQSRKDAERVDAVQKEMERLEDLVKNTQLELQDEVRQTREVATGDVDGLRAALEQASKKQATESGNFNIELQQLRKSVKDNSQIIQDQAKSKAMGTDVISALVESQLLSAALDFQDDKDRRSIALFGQKSDGRERGGFLPDLTGGKQDLGRSPRRDRKFLGNDSDAEPVLSLERKCLSCTGSVGTVLAGFKLACLQYAPGPVNYKNSTYDRSELIQLRITLLNQAKEQLRSIS